MRRLNLLVRVGLLATSVVAGYADTIYVNAQMGNDAWDGRCEVWNGETCGPKRTIQAGIDASGNGDEVVVADGRYAGPGNLNISFRGRSITVRSANGPRACTIDCDNNGRGFTFESGETADAILDGFTVTRGVANTGGGVYCFQSSPQILNCVIRGNRAIDSRGGGGGIFILDASPTLVRCDISDNFTEEQGGGVHLTDSEASFEGCRIEYNRAERAGAGVYSFSAAPHFVNCVVRNNITNDIGGGFDLMHSAATLTNCTVVGNYAKQRDGGGGVLCDRAGSAPSRITNCVIWGNFAPLGPEISVTSAELEVSFCDVKGGQLQVLNRGTLIWGEGNVDMNPLFAFWEDFHQLSGSPIIDAGTNSPPGGLPAIDADGVARPLDGDGDGIAVADIGAYEYKLSGSAIASTQTSYVVTVPFGSSTVVNETLFVRNAGGAPLRWEVHAPCPFVQVVPALGLVDAEIQEIRVSVDANELDVGDYRCDLTIFDSEGGHPPRGTSLEIRVRAPLRVPQDYATVQAAIDAAGQHDLVLIADGVLSGPGNRDLDFRGKELVVRGENGPEHCVIDCEGQSSAFRVSSGEGPEAVIEGLTVLNGHAELGGAFFVAGVFTAPTIRECVISESSADYWGGGVYCSAGSFPNIIRCRITNNRSGEFGGGIMCQSGSRPTIRGCAIAGNMSHFGGGGIALNDSGATIVNCTVTSNVANDYGGGIFAFDSYHRPSIINTIVWDNAASEGNELALRQVDELCQLSVSYSDVEGGEQEVFFVSGNCRLDWGAGNRDQDPLFIDGPNGDYRLAVGSPGIDSADNDFAPPEDVGLDRAPRLVDDPATPDTGNGVAPVVDMGAHEFQLSGLIVPIDIKPGSCPNPFNRRSRGKTPMAVVGTSEFEVADVDSESLLLTRADGAGGAVTPLHGPPGPIIEIEDVATPFQREGCDCHELEGDGIDDLLLKFDTQSMVAELELNGLPGGAMVELVISGRLLDGTDFRGIDCIRLVPPNGGPQETESGDVSPKPSMVDGVPKENGDGNQDSAWDGTSPDPVGCGGLMPILLLITAAGMRLLRKRTSDVMQINQTIVGQAGRPGGSQHKR